MKRQHTKILSFLLCLILIFPLLPAVSATQQTTADHVIISQIYGAGGNKGAVYNADFIELYNPTNYDIDLAGWSLQYGSATGTWPCKTSARYLLRGTIRAHSYYLIACSEGSNGDALPVKADLDDCGLSLAENKGKIALVCSEELIQSKSDRTVVDFVGYGNANDAEGSPAPAPSKTSAIIRKEDGVDTNSNATDFATVTPPSPRNSQTTSPGGSETVIIPVEDGTYILSFGNATLTALPESQKSGYPTSGDLQNYNRRDVVTLTNVGNNRFTIADVYGRLYFLTATDSAFQLAQSPIYGHLWTLIDAGNDTFYIQNVHSGQCISYSPDTATWNTYPYPSGTAKLTLTPAQLITCPHSNGTTAVCIDEARHCLICNDCSAVIDESAGHTFTDGICICGLMEWVTDPEPGKIYKLGLYHGFDQVHLFLTGSMEGFYLATTADITTSINVSLAQADSGYYLLCHVGNTVKYLDIYLEDGYVRIGYQDIPSRTYSWNENHSTLTTIISGRTYYLGGYQSYRTISPVCDLIYPAHFYEITGNLCPHAWQNATCTVAKTCRLCGETSGEARGHSFTDYRSNSDATCTKDGTKTAKCDRCDTVDTVTDVGSAGHADIDGNFRCDRCGSILCQSCYDSPSDRDHLCDQCGSKLAEHTYTTWNETKQATCTKEGISQRKCNCGATEKATVPALGHSFTRYSSNSDATCTEDGTKTAKCDRCDKEDTRTDPGTALGHTLVKVEEIPATSESTGIKAHYQCASCTNLYADADTTHHLSPSDVILPQLPQQTLPPKEDEPIISGIVLDFGNIANRVTLSKEEQIWSQNGITVTNRKENATANIADYYDPVRFYKNTSVTVTYSSISEIRFYCDTPAYAKSLVNSLITSGYPATLSEKTVAVTLDQPSGQITILLTDGQVRLQAISITTGVELPPEAPTEPTQPAPAPAPTDPTEPETTIPIPTEPTIPSETILPTEGTTPTEPTLPSQPSSPTELSATEVPTVPEVTIPDPTTPTREETKPSTDPTTVPTDPTQATTILPKPSIPSEPSDPTEVPSEPPPGTSSPTEETKFSTITTNPNNQNPMVIFLVILAVTALGICLFGIYKKRQK